MNSDRLVQTVEHSPCNRKVRSRPPFTQSMSGISLGDLICAGAEGRCRVPLRQ